MRQLILIFILSLFNSTFLFCQAKGDDLMRVLFRGIVMDAVTRTPVAGAQIEINRSYSYAGGDDGSFSFYVDRNDSVIFRALGYKPSLLCVSDSLSGTEFIAGIYLNNDTISIGEVIIVPRIRDLRYEIMNSQSSVSAEMANARYNVAVSAYQGRNSQARLGDPANNYEVLRQQQRTDAYERGGIPSDKILGLSPFMLIPAAYMLMHGLPEKQAPFKHTLTDQEIDQLQKKYLETLRQR